MMVSNTKVNWLSQPVATRLTRCAMLSMSLNKRMPSLSSSWPAAVSLAWRDARLNNSTSSASSICRTR